MDALVMKLPLVSLAIALFLPLKGLEQSANAQVTPDGTLNTTVSQSGNNFTVNNGNPVGNNLFHSFSQFSIPTNGSVFFNNATTIQNIFARVMGGSASNIDGLIRANGTANLFLLNPAGILFGANASLNLGGSFMATTANSVKFADGTEFSAVNPSTPPLLTISVPIGLQFGQNPGGITVQGSGHRMIEGIFTPIDRSQNPIGLQVGAGNTLALIGGEVRFSGGIASVNGGGHLEVGSVSEGAVRLNSLGSGWVGDYSAVQQFKDIHLAQQSLLDASGNSGSIQLQGRNITLSEGSAALLQNLGAETAGGITVHATESLNLVGTTANSMFRSMIKIDNQGNSQTGDLTISAAQLSLQNGGTINNETFVPVPGANIIVNVAGSIMLESANSSTNSIVTSTRNSAKAGDVTVSTGNLRILNGDFIGSLTLSSGQAGKVQVNAQDLIEIAGINPMIFAPSALISTTLGSGNANTIFVNTSRLVVREGGVVGSNNSTAGSSGSVVINASQSVVVQGKTLGSINSSRIASTIEIAEPAARAAFGLPAIPSGDAGSLTINTPSLRITDGAYVTVKNDGLGSAGDLQVNANSIFLSNQGSITASTASGNGGNIRLDLQSSLIMRHGSWISATALGTGDGGNITLNAPIIAGFENSDIVANAIKGRGGNIQITTQGIIGLQYRAQLTPENDITASSQFGVSGTVQINNIGVDPNSGLVSLPANLVDSSQQIATGCADGQGSSFVATGRGGIPQNPIQAVGNDRTWSDLRDLSAYRKAEHATSAQPLAAKPMLLQATTWQRHPDGSAELLADQPATSLPTVTTCSGTATTAAAGQ